MTPSYVFTHTRLKNPTQPARVGPPRPKECHRDTPPPARLLPKVSYILRPRPLPISGAFKPERMKAIIQRLPDASHRELLTLRYLCGFHLSDVAKIMAYDHSSIWHMHQAAVRELNRWVRQKIGAKPGETRGAGEGWVGFAFVAGVALMAVAWWVTDAVLLANDAGLSVRQLIDTGAPRLLAVALWISGPVAGWYARINYERMPVVDKEVAK